MPEFLQRSPQAFEGRVFTSADGEHVLAIVARGVSTSQLAEELSEALQAFLWDRSGLPAKYYASDFSRSSTWRGRGGRLGVFCFAERTGPEHREKQCPVGQALADLRTDHAALEEKIAQRRDRGAANVIGVGSLICRGRLGSPFAIAPLAATVRVSALLTLLIPLVGVVAVGA